MFDKFRESRRLRAEGFRLHTWRSEVAYFLICVLGSSAAPKRVTVTDKFGREWIKFL